MFLRSHNKAEFDSLHHASTVCRFAVVIMTLVCFGSSLRAQRQEKPSARDQDVVRVTTELIQSDVMIFDKRGHFVDGLKPDQFQLLLEGKPQTVLFFERVAAGTNREARQLISLTTRNKPVENRRDFPEADETDRTRTIFFFVDDTHLNAEGVVRARKAVLDFVENQMRQNDRVAVVSSSGQIGFLQQLTDNKVVLRTAVSRLFDQRNPETYTGKTRITEYMASQIENGNDRRLFAYLMESTKIEQQAGPGSRHGDHRTNASSYSAEPNLRNRLRQIRGQGKLSAAATLVALRGLLSSSAHLPGRKLVFFLSNGFLVDQRGGSTGDLLRSVTEAAAQSGAIIYSFDLRSSSAGSLVDASSSGYVDFSGRTAGLALSETSANREPLQTMADETGGGIILNPNSISEGIDQALEETANYYLLAWRPETSGEREGKARLRVTIKDHPEWRVRLRRKFYTPPLETVAKAKQVPPNAEPKPAVELQAALGSIYPRRTAPVQMSVGYISAPLSKTTLKISMQLDPRLFVSEAENQTRKAELDVLGAAVDDRGKIVTFTQVLNISPETLKEQGPVIWHQQLNVPPGLYQVRLAVRDRALGRTGSAMEWIEVPDLAQPRLEASSLFIGARGGVGLAADSGLPRPVTVSVDHQFLSGSILRFQTYIYNATRSSEKNSPEVEVQAEVLKNGRAVLVTPWAAVPVTAVNDRASLPYWAELPLNQFAAGRYVLRVTAIDRLAKQSVSQQISFTILK